MKYDNPIKGAARGWAWNRICDRIRSKDERRRARIFVLIGDTIEELRVAQTKGFSHFNVIGVDVRPEPVKAWREAGGLAIQAPLEAVIAFSKHDPSAVIADFCGGISDVSFLTFLVSLFRTKLPGCIVMNLLRGRDEIDNYRPDNFLNFCKTAGDDRLSQVSKKRSFIVLMNLFQRIYSQTIATDLKIKTWPPTPEQFKAVEDQFKGFWPDFQRGLSPQFHDYQSKDSSQYFDSLAINSIGLDYMLLFGSRGEFKLGTKLSPEDRAYGLEQMRNRAQFLVTSSGKYDIKSIKQRLAALEAVRTKKLLELKPHYRPKYEAA